MKFEGHSHKVTSKTNYHVCFVLQDMQHKIKEQFRGIPDEFMTSNMASKAKVNVGWSEYMSLVMLGGT